MSLCYSVRKMKSNRGLFFLQNGYFGLLVLASLFYFSHIAWGIEEPLQEPINEAPYVLCRHSKMIRTIRVTQSKEKGPCETLYTKLGVDRKVGYGIHLTSCRQIVDNIRRNLEVADWQCKDITAKASISHSMADGPIREE